MKKILTLIFLFFLINSSVALGFSNYCSNGNAVKSFSGIISSASGASFLARQIVEKEIEKTLKKETGSKFKVKINSFWGTNLTQGEFSKFYAQSKNFSNKNFSSQKLTLETICPYNKVKYENDKLYFDTDIVANFNAEMNENNISQLLNKKVQLVDNKIVLPVKISVFGVKTSFKLKASLGVEDNKIKLCNIELNNQALNASKYASLFQELTNFKVDLNKDAKIHIKVNSIVIKDSLVYLKGYALLPRS